MSLTLTLQQAPAAQAWHYLQSDGQPSEPLTAAEIDAMVQRCELTNESLLWQEGMPEWVPVGTTSFAGITSAAHGHMTSVPPPGAVAQGRPGRPPSMPEEEAMEHVRKAFYAGCVSALVSLLLALSGDSTMWWAVAGMAGILFGVYKASRICAVLMMSFYSFGLVVRAASDTPPGFAGWMIAAVMLFFYTMGIRGTFACQKWRSFRASL